MKTVNVAELKNRLSHYLREVRAGIEIIVRDRDVPIARLVPFSSGATDDEELEALAAAGAIRVGGLVDEGLWSIPAPRVGAADVRRALRAEREDR